MEQHYTNQALKIYGFENQVFSHQLLRSTVDILFLYAQKGLLHGKRTCLFCFGPMRLIKT